MPFKQIRLSKPEVDWLKDQDFNLHEDVRHAEPEDMGGLEEEQRVVRRLLKRGTVKVRASRDGRNQAHTRSRPRRRR